MDKISYNLFVLIVFSIPGSLIFTSYLIHNTTDNICLLNPATYAGYFASINVYSASFFILVSYCIGFICSLFGNLFLRILKLIWKPVTPNKTKLKNSEKFLLVRELSKENFKFIERWNMLTHFSVTFALSIIISCCQLYKNIDCFSWYHLLIPIGICVLLVIQAFKYNTWAIIELDNAVNILKLEEKAKVITHEKKKGQDD